MAYYILFDTETTGITKRDRIIQVGAMIIENKNKPDIYDELCSTDVAIPVEAMMVHGITPDKIANKPKFINTKFYHKLNELNNNSNFLIAHNIQFDLDMLKKEGFENSLNLIDTFRCSRHLLQHEDRHKLQYLRYSLQLYKDEAVEAKKHNITIKAHDAIGDVLVMKLLLSKLVSIVRVKFPGVNPMSKLVELTKTKAVLHKINFGKHSGKTIKEIYDTDRSYLEWLLKNTDDEDMIYTINMLNQEKNDTQPYKPYKTNKQNSTNLPQATKIVEIMPFGKYKGVKLVDICEKDMEYIDWLLENTDDEKFKKQLEYSVDKLINEI